MRIIILAFILCMTSLSVFAKKKLTDEERMLALTPEAAFSLIEIEDDSLDTMATISSNKAFLSSNKYMLPLADGFFRAAVHKKTGESLIQLYQSITYQGNWRFYHGATYESSHGPVHADFKTMSRDVVTCAGGCVYTEQMYFLVDEKVLRDFATKYQVGQPVVWQYKFNSKSGEPWKDSISAAEISGFLRALDEYRISHGFPIQK